MILLVADDLQALAAAIGRHAFVLVGLLALLLVLALAAVVAGGRWIVARREAIQRAVAEAWRLVSALAPVRRLRHRIPVRWRPPAWLTRRAFLGVELACGLALSLALLGFLDLAAAVAGREAITRFDLALAEALHRAGTPFGTRFLTTVTDLGNARALTIVGVVVAVVLLVRREAVLAVGWIVSQAGGGLLNWVLKALYRRARPSFADAHLADTSWSFPSGHSMGTFVACGMLAYVLLIHLRSTTTRVAVVALALVWTLLVGFSRMYLGAHYFSDVVAGFAAGTVWVGACIVGIELVRRARRRGDDRFAAPSIAPSAE